MTTGKELIDQTALLFVEFFQLFAKLLVLGYKINAYKREI